MSTTTETNNDNAIDEKKGNTESKLPDFKGFIKNYISSIIITIGLSTFLIGGLGLYTAKVAQSNILPDNIELEPYTGFSRIVEEIPIDINIIRQGIFADNKNSISQKAIFNSKEYLDSFNGSFLCTLKKYAKPEGLFSNGPLFFSKVYDSIISANFYAINSIFFKLNYLPEPVIMILYGLFGILIFMVMYFFNYCLTVFYYFVHIQELFRNESEEKGKQGFWEETKNISFFSTKLLLFFFWAIICFILLLIMPMITTIYALLSPLYATYKIQSSNETKNVWNFIIDNFVYKKILFFMLCTASLVSNGVNYLGYAYLIGIAVAILFAYYTGLYNLDIPEVNTNGFTANIANKIKQASVMKEMSVKPNNMCPKIPIIQSTEAQPGEVQTGGGKNKKTHSTKKYNIRLV
jgi:hypothetical protein